MIAAEEVPNWIGTIVTPVIVLGMVLTGFLVPKSFYERERDRADKGEEENRLLRDKTETQILPVVHDAINTVKEMAAFVRGRE